ncbi:CGNR zinc finger domain-containing protein [Nocardioides sp.]|uniref:CGNR zinc finger domain-containing protein n=1 Tax=Nocardioides sp. TaxID=35761 RepID=UPI002ED443C4
MTWWATIDGLVLPKQLAGHPALELVNTRSGWGQPFHEKQEYLKTFDHLAVLARANGLLSERTTSRLRRRAASEPEAAAAVLDQARRMRTDLHDVLLDQGSRAAGQRVATAVTDARARQRLDLGAQPGWSFPGDPSLDDALDSFLVAAADLLVARPRIGACPGHDCGWLFLNTSGRRRWCQMAVCGNRAKQAAHARRTTH